MNIHEPSPEFLTSQKLNIGAFPFYTTSVLLLHGEAATILVESSTWIKTLKYTRLPVNCIGVRLKCPWIILSACSNHVYCAPSDISVWAEHKIQSPVQIQSCVQNSLSSAHPHSITCIFCPAGFRWNIVEKLYLRVHGPAYLRCLNDDEADSI